MYVCQVTGWLHLHILFSLHLIFMYTWQMHESVYISLINNTDREVVSATELMQLSIGIFCPRNI